MQPSPDNDQQSMQHSQGDAIPHSPCSQPCEQKCQHLYKLFRAPKIMQVIPQPDGTVSIAILKVQKCKIQIRNKCSLCSPPFPCSSTMKHHTDAQDTAALLSRFIAVLWMACRLPTAADSWATGRFHLCRGFR